MVNSKRDEFNAATRQVLAKRVNYHCSNPDCRAPTAGPHTDVTKSSNAGIAAHITAAAINGPRYECSLTQEQRRHANNGIWLCTMCADLIDDDEQRYPVSILSEWKSEAEAEARAALGKPLMPAVRLNAHQLSRALTQLTISAADASVKTGDETTQSEIERVRLLLKKGHARAALEVLAGLRAQHWESVSAAMRAKIANNEGCAAFALDDIAGAERYFGEALMYEPNSAQMLANLACVELLIGRSDDALTHSSRAHELAPNDENAVAALLQSLYQTANLQRLDEIMIAEPWIETSLACRAALANLAYERGDHRRCEELARSVIESDASEEIMRQMYFLLASALLKPVHTALEQETMDLQTLGPQEKDALLQAEEAYTRVVDTTARDDGRRFFYAALVSRSGVRQSLGRFEEAILDCERVLAEQPDNPGAIENKGRALLRLDRAAEAASCLERVTPEKLEMDDGLETVGSELASRKHLEEWIILLGTAYLHSGQNERVLSLVGPLDAEKDDPEGLGKAELRLYAAASLMNTRGREIEAETIDYLVTAWMSDPRAAAILGKHADSRGDIEGAISNYQRAVNLAPAPAKDTYRFDLARCLFKHEKFDQALPLLRQVTEGREEHPGLSMFAACLFNVGEHVEAAEIAARVRTACGARTGVSEIEADVLERGGNVDAAAALWSELVKAYPRVYRYQIRLAFVEFRRGDAQKARRLAEQVPYDAVKNDVDLLINIARLRRVIGLPEALLYAYRARKIASGDPQAHFNYMICCFNLEDREMKRVLGEHETVEAGDAVFLRRGETATVFILEDEEPYHTGRGDLGPEDRRTKLLIGRCKGEKIILRDGILGPEEYEIIGVKTKYLHASDETSRMFNDGQIEHPSFQVVNVETPDNLELLGGFLDRRSGGTDFAEMYRTTPMPFASYARSLQRSVLEIWLSLTEGAGGQIFAFGGTGEDATQQSCLLSDDRASVSLDLMALLTIVHLSLEDVVRARFRRVLIAQSVMDELRQYEMEVESSMQASGIMGSIYGQRYYLETPQEYLERKKGTVRRLLDFVRVSGAEVVPTMALLDMEEGYRKALGDAALAAALAAVDHGALFYTDDLRLRQISKELWSIDGIDSQAVLCDLNRRDLLDRDLFDEAMAKASRSGYDHVNTNADLSVENSES